ncbi:hypothetical protein J3Q64DRAFT_1617755, partial [Phycomyces blakesleeanus]
GIEVCLLETYGQHKSKDNPRFGYDHLKDAFCCFTVLSQIIRKFFFATQENLLNSKVYFIYAQ